MLVSLKKPVKAQGTFMLVVADEDNVAFGVCELSESQAMLGIEDLARRRRFDIDYNLEEDILRQINESIIYQGPVRLPDVLLNENSYNEERCFPAGLFLG